MTKTKKSGKIECYASPTAVRVATLPEIQKGQPGLKMVFMLSKNGLQIGNFISNAEPEVKLGSAFKITISLEEIDEKEFIKEHGFTEIKDNKDMNVV
jgi:hypothetical protein